MAVNDECKLKFLELKAKRSHRFIVFKIDEKIQQVTVDKVGGPSESYDDFTACLPANECRYAVFDFDFITSENCQKSKIFFIAWYAICLRLSSPPDLTLWRSRSCTHIPFTLTSFLELFERIFQEKVTV